MRKFPDDFNFGELVKSTQEGIVVSARAAYIQEMSNPDKNIFAFAYIIGIENRGDTAVQLLRRHWLITNAAQESWTVDGEGVIGKNPVIKPEESFAYDSWTSLDTPVGHMAGRYTLRRIPSNERLSVAIPRFELRSLRALN